MKNLADIYLLYKNIFNKNQYVLGLVLGSNNLFAAFEQYFFFKVAINAQLLKQATTTNHDKPPQTSTNDHKPSADDHKLPANNHKPPANNHKLPSDDHKLPAITTNHQQTTTTDHNPEANSHKPPPNEHKPPASDHKPLTNNHKRPNRHFSNSNYLIFSKLEMRHSLTAVHKHRHVNSLRNLICISQATYDILIGWSGGTAKAATLEFCSSQ